MTRQRILISILIICLIAGSVWFFLLRQHWTVRIPPLSPSFPSALPAPEPQPYIPKQLRYHTLKLETVTPLAELTDIVEEDQIPTILALNRIDAKHIRTGTTLVIPDAEFDMMALSPFPAQLPLAIAIPKLVFVAQSNQAFAAYEYGTLVRWGAVSTGKQSTPTPSKLYYTNWKGELVISTVDDEWIMPWYFNLDNFAGISLHQYELPGYPASHSCVRLSETDAKWFYDWADQWVLSKKTGAKLANGTPVIVFGTYSYSNDISSESALIDQRTLVVETETLYGELSSYLSDIQENIAKRTSVLEPIP